MKYLNKFCWGFFLYGLICMGFMSFSQKATAQELNAQVVIQTPKLNLTDPQVFNTLENDLREFINNRKWTDDVYKGEERIECSFLITITEEVGASTFKASTTIQANRPVYNAAYSSPIFNHQDKTWEFDYAQYQPLEYNENANLSELTSLVAYYVYIILGIDGDTFQPNGGTDHFLQAQNIVNNSQNTKIKGWKAFDGTRNRYWLVNNFLDTKLKTFRKAYYDYHRKGLDMMYDNVLSAASSMSNAIDIISKLRNNNSNAMLFDIFNNAKSVEIISLFSLNKIPPPVRMKAVNGMTNIDPANSQKYQKIAKQSMSGQNPMNNGFKNSTRNGVPLRNGPTGGHGRN